MYFLCFIVCLTGLKSTSKPHTYNKTWHVLFYETWHPYEYAYYLYPGRREWMHCRCCVSLRAWPQCTGLAKNRECCKLSLIFADCWSQATHNFQMILWRTSGHIVPADRNGLWAVFIHWLKQNCQNWECFCEMHVLPLTSIQVQVMCRYANEQNAERTVQYIGIRTFVNM